MDGSMNQYQWLLLEKLDLDGQKKTSRPMGHLRDTKGSAVPRAG